MKLILKGVVQGVGFRPTVYKVAKRLGYNGYVKNMGGEVEVGIDGDEDVFLKELQDELPPLAEIKKVEKLNKKIDNDGFEIIKSTSGEKESSTIPVDTAICEDCLKEMKNKSDRRYNYPFTNCTNCGARYSAIYELPYDRKKTTMDPFPMCKECKKEYKDPMDRRFHAQTTSCDECGPKYRLFNKDKKKIGDIGDFVSLIEKGRIGVAKSWGGMHIVCKLEKIPRLRDIYQRPQKPFALMMANVETVEKYAKVEREDLLKGGKRPIMIFEKKEGKREWTDLAAPGLPTVGIMLPYTGFHHIFFEESVLDSVVMTSANLPGEPMITENNDAFDLPFDYFLLHNRRIANRVDDSLVRTHGNDAFIIRRSRGYVPSAIDFLDEEVIAAGADKSGCLAVSTDGLLYASQYLGDLESYEANMFYKETGDHLISLLGVENPTKIGVDLHPKYHSRKLGLELAKKYDLEVVEIQHHWAHGASLLLEHDLEEIITIAIDGTGYGEDGQSWGGEILYCNSEEYKRLGHLEPFPLLGGEEAVKDPKRLVYAIKRKMDEKSDYFNEKKRDIFDDLMEKSSQTTSFGRLLDAVAYELEVCDKRTYEGEPAMKLEQLLMQGKNITDYDVKIKNGTIKTLDPFISMCEDDLPAEDLAYSYIKEVSESLAEKAIEASEEMKVNQIGISGGVSYNRPIVETISSYLEKKGYDLLTHDQIPNGDMGIPFGQAVIISNW